MSAISDEPPSAYVSPSFFVTFTSHAACCCAHRAEPSGATSDPSGHITHAPRPKLSSHVTSGKASRAPPAAVAVHFG